MAKVWKIVLWIVLIMFAAGLVLLGAAKLTGTSLPRIAKLGFGGTEEAMAAAEALLSRGRSALTDGLEWLQGLTAYLPF